MSILTLSDPSGTFECLVFSEQLDKFDSLLTTGQSVVLEVEADAQPDGVRLRLINLHSIDKAVARMANKMTLFLENTDGLSSLQNQLTRGGEGQVSVVVMGEDKTKEYEIELPGNYRLSHELASSLKVVPGVEDAKVSVHKAQ